MMYDEEMGPLGKKFEKFKKKHGQPRKNGSARPIRQPVRNRSQNAVGTQ